MILNSPYISGSLTVTGNEVVTGSLTVLGGITGAITGSATSASYAANASFLNGLGSEQFVPTGSFNTFSSSILTYTGSANSRLGSLETTSGSNITRLGALEVTSGSNITRLGALEVASGSAITRLNSIETVTGSNITRLSSLESKTGSYATTGSNTFVGGQYLSSSFNPTGFSTTASLYTDGGLRVTRDAYISGTLYLNNVTVYGTQSVAYISSSQLNIGTNIITVNTDVPSVRFGGLAVYDSGSTGLTGSILWDSQNNHWVYSNPSGSSYSGGMFISGPRASSLGSETGTTSCMLLAGQGGDHLTSSMIYHSSTVTCVPNTLIGNTICSTIGTFSNTAGQPSVNVRSSDTNFSLISVLGNQAGDVNWLLMSGYPNAGDFTIRQSDVINALTIKKTNGIACFSSRVCSPSLTTSNLRISDESTFGLFICKGPDVYPVVRADNGQSIGFYTGEAASPNTERLKIWQNGIITIGCQVCLIQLTVSNAGGTSHNIANFINTTSTTNAQTYFFMGGNLSNGRSGFMDWVDNTDCANGYLAFGVYGDNPASGTGNGLMIKRGACVGINNNNPLRYLHIGPGTDSPINPNNGLYVTDNGTTAITLRDSTNNVEYTEQVGSTGAIVGTLTNHDLITYVNNAEVSRLQNGGNVFYAGTGGLGIHKGTTAQRPSSCTGMMRYNTTFNLMEFYNGTTWVQMGSGDLATGFCFNNLSMCHSVYRAAGTLGLQGQGSPCISIYGAATLSMGVYVGNNYFSTHGGHCGISDYPGYWAVNLGAARAVNQLKVWIHSNSWGYFELQGSNNSGNASGFDQSGTWTTLSFLCSNINNCQNMGGNSSGCSDGTVFNFWYTNDVPFQAYRIKVLDSSRPNQALGTTYAGSAGYIWQLNRV